MQTVNYRKGLGAMSVCFFIWGFQPLYWYMCTNVCGEIDTFFIMACRIIWAAVTCLCILKVQGKLPQLWAVFKDKQVLKREMPASVLLFGDWLVYLWAVQNGRVLECSLGYYIQPLVVFALGAVIFREKMNWRHFVIIAIVVVGIVFSTSGFGGVPYVTIALALMFSIYAAIKKSLTIDSIVSTTSEILMMVPVALLFILFFRMGDNGMGSMTVVKQLLMIGGGVITGLPMVFYSIGVRHLPLMTTGICQYISPSLSIICGAIMGEALTREKLVSFLFIWTGVLLYVLNTVYEEKGPSRRGRPFCRGRARLNGLQMGKTVVQYPVLWVSVSKGGERCAGKTHRVRGDGRVRQGYPVPAAVRGIDAPRYPFPQAGVPPVSGGVLCVDPSVSGRCLRGQARRRECLCRVSVLLCGSLCLLQTGLGRVL